MDSLFSHFAWLRLIRDRYGIEVRFPVIEDPSLVIARGFGMACVQDKDSAAVRSTFFIDPEGIIRAVTCYPANLGRSVPEMLRMLDGLQAADATSGLVPANWQPSEALLAPPSQNLDSVFDAEEATAWFLQAADAPKK